MTHFSSRPPIFWFPPIPPLLLLLLLEVVLVLWFQQRLVHTATQVWLSHSTRSKMYPALHHSVTIREPSRHQPRLSTPPRRPSSPSTTPPGDELPSKPQSRAEEAKAREDEAAARAFEKFNQAAFVDSNKWRQEEDFLKVRRWCGSASGSDGSSGSSSSADHSLANLCLWTTYCKNTQPVLAVPGATSHGTLCIHRYGWLVVRALRSSRQVVPSSSLVKTDENGEPLIDR